MSDKPVLVPGPDHPIEIRPAEARVTVRSGDRLIAESDSALLLSEKGYPPVPYLPLADVDHGVLEASTHATYCPYKGDASYYSLRIGDELVADAVWCYVSPHQAVAEIAGFVAFTAGRVEVVVADRS